jgi:hypothetical protein
VLRERGLRGLPIPLQCAFEQSPVLGRRSARHEIPGRIASRPPPRRPAAICRSVDAGLWCATTTLPSHSMSPASNDSRSTCDSSRQRIAATSRRLPEEIGMTRQAPCERGAQPVAGADDQSRSVCRTHSSSPRIKYDAAHCKQQSRIIRIPDTATSRACRPSIAFQADPSTSPAIAAPPRARNLAA